MLKCKYISKTAHSVNSLAQLCENVKLSVYMQSDSFLAVPSGSQKHIVMGCVKEQSE